MKTYGECRSSRESQEPAKNRGLKTDSARFYETKPSRGWLQLKAPSSMIQIPMNCQTKPLWEIRYPTVEIRKKSEGRKPRQRDFAKRTHSGVAAIWNFKFGISDDWRITKRSHR